jgi:hypothetical protein
MSSPLSQHFIRGPKSHEISVSLTGLLAKNRSRDLASTKKCTKLCTMMFAYHFSVVWWGNRFHTAASLSVSLQCIRKLTFRCPFRRCVLFSLGTPKMGGSGIAQSYSAGLRAGWSGVWIPAGAGNFSLHHRVQTGSEAYPTSYPMSNRGSFPGGKAAGSWSWPLASI